MQKPKIDRALERHIKALGLASIKEYRQWCKSHNVAQGLNKNRCRRKNEIALATRYKATKILKHKKRETVPERIIRILCDRELRIRTGEPSEHTTTAKSLYAKIESALQVKLTIWNRQFVRALRVRFRDAADPKSLRDALIFLLNSKKSTLLKPHGKMRALEGGLNANLKQICEMVNEKDQWIRDLRDWRPTKTKKCPAEQLASLRRHLYACHFVPRFLDKYCRSETVGSVWWNALASGESLRTVDLPIPLTKKMIHHFLNTPRHLSLADAFVRAQVSSIIKVVSRTQVKILCKKFGNTNGHNPYFYFDFDEELSAWDFYVRENDFCLNILRFFARHSQLTNAQITLLMDYLLYKKAHQPGFALKGRKATLLLRDALEWKKLGGMRDIPHRSWQPSGIKAYSYRETDPSSGAPLVWRVRELLCLNDLIEESKVLSHCVGTANVYTGRCIRGATAIFTMDAKKGNRWEKLLTLEVARGNRHLRQVAGKCNREPTEEEQLVLLDWAAREGLRYEV